MVCLVQPVDGSAWCGWQTSTGLVRHARAMLALLVMSKQPVKALFVLKNSVLWSLLHARVLLRALTARELNARHAGSAAGLAWAYLQPLLTVAAYYLVFDVVFAMRLGDGAPTHAVGTYLIVGALPWMAFGDAISRGTNSLLDAGGLLQKNPLPPSLFPARAVLASAVIFSPLMLGLIVAYIPVHHGALAVLSVPVLWCLQVLMVFWWSHLLAILSAAVRDTTQVVTFALQVGIFLSPALFPYSQFPQAWRWVLWINPMTPALLGYQDALLQGAWPSWPVWVAMGLWIVVLAGLTKLAIARSRDQLVDWL